ncbi:hypothetical protein PIROE2DRAFT_61462 [Piromyces sp. E2]|nr:hypothetical protein PIROE2DRAFT_61462 [Piromyces sp. E2]|eukprot:OUM63128.1 hypothetical protein PIROE2DRAFT_61462 [Piromyces sp. E2]
MEESNKNNLPVEDKTSSSRSHEEDTTMDSNDLASGLVQIAQAMNQQTEILKMITPLFEVLDKIKNSLDSNNNSNKLSTDGDGSVVITSYDVPTNHFSDTNSFKGVDSDVERFLGMCEK